MSVDENLKFSSEMRSNLKKQKYNNTPVYECSECAHYDYVKFSTCEICKNKKINFFPSKKEFTRWKELLILEKTGHIKCLKRQVKYPVLIDGIKIFTYIADFDYYDEDGNQVIEDSKGFETAIFKIKRKAVEAYYKIRVTTT